MNNTLKKLVYSEHKRFITLIILFTVSLVLSGVIYAWTNSGSSINIQYESISKLAYFEILKIITVRNIIYFIVIIFLTCIGQGLLINLLFFITSIYYGLSVIYFIRAISMSMKYFLLIFTDYFVLFPIIFYFTYISSSISKYTKKAKNIETISNKFDIIISSYIKVSFIFLFIVTGYSFVYSFYIFILSRLMV